ncbi:ArnT family glycosyltransferase [Halosegnis marinus]|uniref:ArnT family glycosyltransferase n=1 Tax=Halosegnis marinus TaxID=3034023 RepID=UPI0036109E52
MERPDRDTLLLAALSVAAGVVVLFVAVELFPHHSSNHDEGVYLQQAHLLLDGALGFRTPLPDAFRWWFFVEDGATLYSKYQPVVPAMFAVGLAVGAPRLVLAAVGAGVVALVGLLTREAYDGPTGVVAGALVLASPLFLLTTSVFLPYAPTALLNLAFAYAYVRLFRSGGRGWALLAGTATGLAFFARPYTAVLFALPFIAHACLSLWRARGDRPALRWRVERLLPVAVLGTAFVALALAYNLLLTGDPLEFPFLAFAPEDGIGFGHREILGYEREYTPALGLEANARVLWTFATRFVAAPPLGAVAAFAGLGLLARRLRRDRDAARRRVGSLAERFGSGPAATLSDTTIRLLLAGVLLSVVVGNVAFWGNLNVLSDLTDPTDGLIAQFGPFYHYDLLLPLSAFGASALVAGGRRLRALAARRTDRRRAATVLVVVALVVALVAGGAQVAALDGPVEENAEYTERYANAYEPFADGEPEGVVFVPTPYGGWLGHPFQSLYNDAGLDGRTVYALDRSPGRTSPSSTPTPTGTSTATPTGGVDRRAARRYRRRTPAARRAFRRATPRPVRDGRRRHALDRPRRRRERRRDLRRDRNAGRHLRRRVDAHARSGPRHGRRRGQAGARCRRLRRQRRGVRRRHLRAGGRRDRHLPPGGRGRGAGRHRPARLAPGGRGVSAHARLQLRGDVGRRRRLPERRGREPERLVARRREPCPSGPLGRGRCPVRNNLAGTVVETACLTAYGRRR